MVHYANRSIELNHMNPGIVRAVRDTVAVFRDAAKFLREVVLTHWEELRPLDSRKRLTAVERLIHTTGKNQAAYPEFDRKFYKFPSYYRRSLINLVVGAVSSYVTNLENYRERRYTAISGGRKFREAEPAMGELSAWPSMYYAQMYGMDFNRVWLKLRIRNTWDWVEVSAPNRDMRDLYRVILEGGKLDSPQMVIRSKKIYLDFPVGHPCGEFSELPVEKQTVLGVDLGINHGAVCCTMDSNGTIGERRFDPFSSERDRISHMLNRLRRVAKESGAGQSLAAFYTKLDGLKKNYVRQLARWVVDQAREAGVYGIVLEHLGKMKMRGSKKDRLHHWCRQQLFRLIYGMALRYGIRVFRINPRNTSKLAFDGSGEVMRDPDNFSMCTFRTGKRYHCDLSASYNIAARYFIRAYQKSMPETVWSECTAKVPALLRRTDCTWSDLRKLLEVLPAALSQAA